MPNLGFRPTVAVVALHHVLSKRPGCHCRETSTLGGSAVACRGPQKRPAGHHAATDNRGVLCLRKPLCGRSPRIPRVLPQAPTYTRTLVPSYTGVDVALVPEGSSPVRTGVRPVFGHVRVEDMSGSVDTCGISMGDLWVFLVTRLGDLACHMRVTRLLVEGRPPLRKVSHASEDRTTSRSGSRQRGLEGRDHRDRYDRQSGHGACSGLSGGGLDQGRGAPCLPDKPNPTLQGLREPRLPRSRWCGYRLRDDSLPGGSFVNRVLTTLLALPLMACAAAPSPTDSDPASPSDVTCLDSAASECRIVEGACAAGSVEVTACPPNPQACCSYAAGPTESVCLYVTFSEAIGYETECVQGGGTWNWGGQ